MRILSRHFLASYPKLFALILFSSTIAVTVIFAAFTCYGAWQLRRVPR